MEISIGNFPDILDIDRIDDIRQFPESFRKIPIGNLPGIQDIDRMDDISQISGRFPMEISIGNFPEISDHISPISRKSNGNNPANLRKVGGILSGRFPEI